jgi:hypothetical protein
MSATIIDRNGRRLHGRRIVPDGGRASVPLPFMDARSALVERAFGDGPLHRPGFAKQALGDGFEATTSNQRSQSASEVARQDYINRISNQWRQTWQRMPPSAHKPKPGLASYDPGDAAGDDTDDNATMGITKADAPDDVQQMSLTQQNAYVSAFNQHAEENPEDGFDECDQAGREAIAALGQDSSVFEAIRADAHKRYCDRVRDAWKST